MMTKKLSPCISILKCGVLALLFCSVSAFAVEKAEDLTDIASNLTDSFSALGSMMMAVAYLAGIGFTIAAIFKFKQHKDNPTQIPVGTPLAMMAIGIVLIFMPMLIKPAGTTIFGTDSTAGGFKGGGISGLPGYVADKTS